MIIKPTVLIDISGVFVPQKKMDKRLRSGLILLIVAVMLAGSTLAIMVSGNKDITGNAAAQSSVNGNSEIYFAVGLNPTPENQMTRVLENGYNLTFDSPGSWFNFTMNKTVNLTVSVVNRQQKDMNYSILAYQALPDQNNNSVNMTQLYYGPLDMIQDNNIAQYMIQVEPAFSGNNTIIGVALLDGSGSDAHILNKTDITANVFPA